MPHLAEDLLLLAVDPGHHRLESVRVLDYGLRAAELAELIWAERVTIETSDGPIRLSMRNAAPLGDELLDSALRSLVEGRSPLTPKSWIAKAAPTLRRSYLKRLSEANAVRYDERERTVVPGRLELLDPRRRLAVKERLDRVLSAQAAQQPGDAGSTNQAGSLRRDNALAGITAAIGLGDRLYAGLTHRRERERLRAFATTNWLASTVRRAIPSHIAAEADIKLAFDSSNDLRNLILLSEIPGTDPRLV
jgi:hypothetical protein